MGLNAMFAAGVDVAKYLQLKNAESYGSMKSRKKMETKIQEKFLYTEEDDNTTVVEPNNTNYFVGDGVFLQYQPDQFQQYTSEQQTQEFGQTTLMCEFPVQTSQIDGTQIVQLRVLEQPQQMEGTYVGISSRKSADFAIWNEICNIFTSIRPHFRPPNFQRRCMFSR